MKDPQLTALKRQLKAEPRRAVTPVAAQTTASTAQPELDDAALFAEATRGARKLSTQPPPPSASGTTEETGCPDPAKACVC